MVGRIVVKIVSYYWWEISPIRQNKQNLKIVGVSACFAISGNGEIATNNIKQFFNDTTNHSGDIAKQALPPTILKFSMLSLIGEIVANNIKQPPTILKFSLFRLIGEIVTNNIKQLTTIPPTIPEILQNRHLHQQFGNFLNDTTNHSGDIAKQALPPTILKFSMLSLIGEIATNNIKQFSQRYDQPFRDIAKQALPPTIFKFSLFRLIGEIATNNIKQFFNDTTNHSGDIAKQALPPTILKFSMLSLIGEIAIKQALTPTIKKFSLFRLIGEIATNNIKQFSQRQIQRYHQPFRRYCKTGTYTNNLEIFAVSSDR
ncbi:unnamed protein product [Schistosoma mattheei]|uniref:Uncharacterized protein n=1 Tax=Schistosoma mattheei TaxID=31246 RepID=A0A183PPF9_9TREM|nr:unnamed protein product [Schistosoma mattheei]